MADVAARMTVGLPAFGATYAEAFTAYLAQQDERHLRAAYELGREAVLAELSVLDLALVHHEALAAALPDRADRGPVARAGEFFLEALSAYEMVRRGFAEARDAAALERHQADLLRQLSNFLTDASVALGASDSLDEVLQLVAEQGRELLQAASCRVTLEVEGGRHHRAVSAEEAAPDPDASLQTLREPLTTLDGREVGLIEVSAPELSRLDAAVLVQLAQMASAAVERRRLYRDA